ncbi:MAG TPA: EF-hand domain-containing protein [Gemmataceae bacterium]|nr:EF-hand domain-containing protein [Gemmataceae bacterium]
MSTPRRPALLAASLAAVLMTPGLVFAQAEKVKPVGDEFRVFLKEVEESYKAQYEVDKDVLDELRKQYRDPKPDREARIFRDIRRLYNVTADQEASILREIRVAYERPSPEQEERIFREIHKAEKLPPGTIPEQVQTERAARMFRRLDRNGDGLLDNDEMTEGLRDGRAKWDRNGDGFIDPDEYTAYFQTHLKKVAEGVASGEIPLAAAKLAAAAAPPPAPTPGQTPRPAAAAGKAPALPAWFSQLDTDGDGQVGLYEWKAAGRPIAEFLAMDANGDGFLEASEVQAYLAEQARAKK